MLIQNAVVALETACLFFMCYRRYLQTSVVVESRDVISF